VIKNHLEEQLIEKQGQNDYQIVKDKNFDKMMKVFHDITPDNVYAFS
jgi:hypothetical protein